MNPKAPIVASEDEDHVPSRLALENARKMAELESGQVQAKDALAGVQRRMDGIESLIRMGQDDTRAQISRLTQRNPSLYIGLASILIAIVGGASALTIFTINSQIKPINDLVASMADSIDDIHSHERADFETLIETRTAMRIHGLLESDGGQSEGKRKRKKKSAP